MFKRANKITSLLVAAASVATMVPAYAADVKKVDSQDGTVYNAVAYKNGQAYIDGEVNDTDAAYYYKDGKYSALDSVDSGSDVSAYGSKYVKVDDGKDYNVDLESGKVLDSDVPGDAEDDAAAALRKEIKDGDRYADADVASATITLADNSTKTVKAFGDASIADLTEMKSGLKFGDTWYQTYYAPESDKKGASSAQAYSIYTDAKGNFIDADYNLGKIKVATTSASLGSASVTIENTKDTYKLRTDKATFAEVSGQNVLGQDKDYIYRFAYITVVTEGDANHKAEINGKMLASTGSRNLTIGVNTVSVDEFKIPVIQKISKAQDSDKIDDGQYSKNVYNYFLTTDGAAYGDSKVDAYTALAEDAATKATVVGGKLVLYKVTNNSSADPNVEIQAATLKQKNGYYYTDVESDANKKAEYSSKLDKVAIDTDTDGNIYVLDGGYVKKFDGTDDWTKVYKVDGSFDSLSVYDKDNMVAWSQGDEVYSVIGGKTADDTKKDDTTPATTVTAGWAKNTDGSWSFNKADGTKATGWFQDTTGTWYYANTAGVMAANAWAQDSTGAWYYLGGSGAMTVNAWVQSGGKYYYVGANGAMLVNTTTPDGYWVGADGAWV